MSNPIIRRRERESRVQRNLWGKGYGLVATRSLQTLIILAIATILVVVGIRLKTEVIALLLAVILASAFGPVTRLLRTRARFPRTLAALTTVLLALSVLAGVLTLVGFAVAGQYKDLAGAAKSSIVQLTDFLRNSGLPIAGNLNKQLLDTFENWAQEGNVSAYALEGITTVSELLTGAVLMIIILFFLLRDGASIWQFLTTPLRGELHQRALRIGDASVSVLGAYARGTAVVAFTDALLIGIGLAILGVPLALPLAVIVFIAAFIPIVGATAAGTLATAVALVSQGPLVAIIVVAIVVGVNQLESHLLQPFIMGRAVSLHPLAVLLALVAGTILGGIVGAILAVPFASVTWAAIKAWRHPEEEMDALQEDAVVAK